MVRQHSPALLIFKGIYMDEKEYFVWSIEHNAWWKPNSSGYCTSWTTAGRYSIDEAFNICARANWTCLREVPVPAIFFEYQIRLHQVVKDLPVEQNVRKLRDELDTTHEDEEL
jgi:hypothetical protein